MSDYERIAKAIHYVTDQAGQQPTLDEMAAHVHLSPYHFQRLFTRWAGVTPKRFLQVLTVERAKKLLQEAKPILEVTHEVGLSSGSRLYDHFVSLEAVTPGEFKTQGSGLTIEYGVHETVFGSAFIAVTPRGICNFSFPEESNAEQEINDLVKRWPYAQLINSSKHTAEIIESMFALENDKDRPLSLLVSGTNFQVSVWRALLRIPMGKVVSYSQVAASIGRPNSARAVGTAIGSNPIGFLIPCHRVIQQSGNLGGYRWGETRKHAIHLWEAARTGLST
ncbi:MAG: methylated-DNA--[protein]-cysteine S-methyltransferase [Gammaproteobacteria bacterium]|nr:methylated-DNA--[protein]-cysteine S-methyltransferase [Gammaproteobacteria bacterium]